MAAEMNDIWTRLAAYCLEKYNKRLTKYNFYIYFVILMKQIPFTCVLNSSKVAKLPKE